MFIWILLSEIGNLLKAHKLIFLFDFEWFLMHWLTFTKDFSFKLQRLFTTLKVKGNKKISEREKNKLL